MRRGMQHFDGIGTATSRVVQVMTVLATCAVVTSACTDSPQPLFGIGADGKLWYAEAGEPWIHRWSASEGVVQTIGREFDPPNVTEAELQEALDDEVEELRAAGGADAVAEFTGRIPERKPYLQGLFLDDEQNVWTIRSRSGGEDDRPMDIYDPSGTLVASTRAAVAAEPRPRVRNGLLAGVVRDELDVESIALYRIER